MSGLKDAWRATDARLERRSAPQIGILAIVLCALVVGLDVATGGELSVSVFYLAPISLAAWYIGMQAGFLFGLVAAGLWLTAELTSGHLYAHALIPWWDAGVWLAIFTLHARLLAGIRAQLRRERDGAAIDPLTGALNGRSFCAATGRMMSLALRAHEPTTVVYIDVDNFKAINEERGHTVGDRVLERVGATILAGMRVTDLVGRLAGDEFAILLPATGVDGLDTVLPKLREALEADARAHNWPIGFSIGAAVFPAPPHAVDTAISAADKLMEQAKAAGKNRTIYAICSPDGQPVRPDTRNADLPPGTPLSGE